MCFCKIFQIHFECFYIDAHSGSSSWTNRRAVGSLIVSCVKINSGKRKYCGRHTAVLCYYSDNEKHLPSWKHDKLSQPHLKILPYYLLSHCDLHQNSHWTPLVSNILRQASQLRKRVVTWECKWMRVKWFCICVRLQEKHTELELHVHYLLNVPLNQYVLHCADSGWHGFRCTITSRHWRARGNSDATLSHVMRNRQRSKECV